MGNSRTPSAALKMRVNISCVVAIATFIAVALSGCGCDGPAVDTCIKDYKKAVEDGESCSKFEDLMKCAKDAGCYETPCKDIEDAKEVKCESGKEENTMKDSCSDVKDA